jgi:2-keto-4-pentenoate hydratase/2-oxohepta-3-ene-1,7-dioic acid hydratase in catechol pathway
VFRDVARYVRFEAGGEPAFGRLDGETVHRLDGDFLSGGRPDGTTHALPEVRLLAPVTPGKIVAVGLNYASHLGTREAPTEPGLFAKFPSCVIGPGDDIVLPADTESVHYEGEMVLVIGKRASKVSAADAVDHLFGITAGNDVSARHWQRDDLQWLRAKATDTFAPLGPAVVTGLEFGDLRLRTRLNAELVQEARTSDLIFGVPQILEYITRYVTLDPGDVVFTGTPGTTSRIEAGDSVEVEIEGVGVLRNGVIRET